MEFSGRTWRPPYERDTPIIEATTGCAWGQCSFCNLFEEERFSVGSLEKFERELDEVKSYIPYTRRLWLTGGSPFQMSFPQLEARANAVRDRLIKCQSIAMFASVRDIERKTDDELRRLRSLQVNGLTVGMESGSDEALSLANKGYTSDDILRQLSRLDAVGIEYNVTYVTGLLGAHRGQWHAYETARVLNELNPKIIGVSSLTVFPGTRFATKIESGHFTPASEVERLEELKTFMGELCLRVHLEASTKSNAIPIRGILPYDKPLLEAKLDDAISKEIEKRELEDYREKIHSLGWEQEPKKQALGERAKVAKEAARVFESSPAHYAPTKEKEAFSITR